MQEIEAPGSDFPRMFRRELLCPDEDLGKFIIGSRQPSGVPIGTESPQCRRFLRLVDFSPKTLQAYSGRNFERMNVGENKRIARCFDDRYCFSGVCLEDITLHKNPGINISTQVCPRSSSRTLWISPLAGPRGNILRSLSIRSIGAATFLLRTGARVAKAIPRLVIVTASPS